MGIMCQVLLHPNLDGFYRPGDRVLGVVKYSVDKESKFEDIVLSFHGNGKCSWSETTGTGKNSTTHLYQGTEDIFKVNQSILPRGKVHNRTVTLPIGAYEHGFDFRIPEGVPPSHKDQIGQIIYELRVTFVRQGVFKFNKEIFIAITVKSKASLQPQEPIIYGIDKTLITLFSSNKNRINVDAEIQKSCLLAGENADLKLVVRNHSKVLIPCIEAKIVEKRIYTSNCGRTQSYTKYIGECKARTASVPAHSVAHPALSVPSAADLFTIHSSSVIAKQYFLKVTLKLPLPYINSSVEIPLEFAGAQWEGVNQRPILANINSSIGIPPEIAGEWSGVSVGPVLPTAPPGPSTDYPPSYEEAMSENITIDKKI